MFLVMKSSLKKEAHLDVINASFILNPKVE